MNNRPVTLQDKIQISGKEGAGVTVKELKKVLQQVNRELKNLRYTTGK
jgi:hypothetical protein